VEDVPVRTESPGTLRIAMRMLRPAFAQDWKMTGIGMALLLGVSGMTLLEPWPLKIVIDSVIGNQAPPPFLARMTELVVSDAPFIDDPKHALLFVLCISFLIINLVIGVLTVSSTYVLIAVGLRLVFRLRCALFDHVQRLSLSFHDATSVGDSLYRIAWDTYAAQTLFNGGVVPAITAALTLVGIVVVMLAVDWVVTLVALAVGIPLVVLIKRLDKPLSDRSMHVHERESAVTTRVQETLTGIRSVQAFGREEIESGRFQDQAATSLQANLKLTVLQTGSQAMVGLLLALGAGAVLWIGASRALNGSLTAGDVVLLLAYVAMLYKPLETLAYTAVTVQQATAGARRVYAVLDTEPEIQDIAGALALPQPVSGQIDFEHVSFQYDDGTTAIRDITLRIAPATTVAIVGGSGAGKTTLLNLILRFYDPRSGRIMVDGRDLRDLKLDSLRDSIALVLQEPVLFAASIAENISYARPAATQAQVESAALAAGADEFIRRLPNGYETAIGERGVNLSGGQRQRISIARAFLKDSPILILDEPTSALDAESETHLVDSLNALMRGRTTIIVAHRLSTIQHADHVIVLGNGDIQEQGSYDSLLRSQGPFRKLYDAQFASRTQGDVESAERESVVGFQS
jgi:ABC-type multidrug transport system fused ATPase/permease subunit